MSGSDDGHAVCGREGEKLRALLDGLEAQLAVKRANGEARAIGGERDAFDAARLLRPDDGSARLVVKDRDHLVPPHRKLGAELRKIDSAVQRRAVERQEGLDHDVGKLAVGRGGSAPTRASGGR